MGSTVLSQLSLYVVNCVLVPDLYRFTTGLAILGHPDYVYHPWHSILIAWLLAVIVTLYNVYGSKTLAAMNSFACTESHLVNSNLQF